jgi:predicted transposase YdaD
MNVSIKQDSLWKGIIEDLFEDFLLYFYPDWAKAEVDFSRKFDFLDKELDEIFPSEKGKKRFADKLVKIPLLSGEEQWMLIHLEVQGYQDISFTERMFTYFYRIKDRWRKDLMAMAIFTDNDPLYHPQEYVYQYQNTQVHYQFDTFKILSKTLEELNIPHNPFSIVMLTARKALEKRATSDKQQLIWKKQLILALKEANYSGEKIRKILNFIRYYVKFGKEENLKQLEQDIQQIFKQRKNMGIEEIILEEVKEYYLQEGKAEGEQLGLQKGELKTKIQGIQKALSQKVLTLEQIADLFEVSLDFVLRVQKGEIQ